MTSVYFFGLFIQFYLIEVYIVEYCVQFFSLIVMMNDKKLCKRSHQRIKYAEENERSQETTVNFFFSPDNRARHTNIIYNERVCV